MMTNFFPYQCKYVTKQLQDTIYKSTFIDFDFEVFETSVTPAKSRQCSYPLFYFMVSQILVHQINSEPIFYMGLKNLSFFAEIQGIYRAMLKYGSVDLLSHFTKVKCNSLTQFFCVVLVTQGIAAMGVKRTWASSTTEKN